MTSPEGDPFWGRSGTVVVSSEGAERTRERCIFFSSISPGAYARIDVLISRLGAFLDLEIDMDGPSRPAQRRLSWVWLTSSSLDGVRRTQLVQGRPSRRCPAGVGLLLGYRGRVSPCEFGGPLSRAHFAELALPRAFFPRPITFSLSLPLLLSPLPIPPQVQPSSPADVPLHSPLHSLGSRPRGFVRARCEFGPSLPWCARASTDCFN